MLRKWNIYKECRKINTIPIVHLLIIIVVEIGGGYFGIWKSTNRDNSFLKNKTKYQIWFNLSLHLRNKLLPDLPNTDFGAKSLTTFVSLSNVDVFDVPLARVIKQLLPTALK